MILSPSVASKGPGTWGPGHTASREDLLAPFRTGLRTGQGSRALWGERRAGPLHLTGFRFIYTRLSQNPKSVKNISHSSPKLLEAKSTWIQDSRVKSHAFSKLFPSKAMLNNPLSTKHIFGCFPQL